MKREAHRGTMLARVAENLFWISRYVERAENLARLLSDAYQRELESGLSGIDVALRPVAQIARWLGSPDEGTGAEVLAALALSPESPISLRTMVRLARENARGSQETLSAEAFRRLNQFHHFLGGPRARMRLESSPIQFFERCRRECLLFRALVDGTLSRGEVFHFLQLGRYLERVDMTTRIILAACQLETDEVNSTRHWVSLLRVCSAHDAYLEQYQDRVDPVEVVGFLLLNSDFPRSVRFGVSRCLESLRALGTHHYGLAVERGLGRLEGDLHYTDAGELTQRGIGPFLIGIIDSCALAGEEIHRSFFLA